MEERAENGRFIIALDSGTTSCRALVFNERRAIVASAQEEFEQIYPKPGWVEHDPTRILATQLAVLNEALTLSRVRPEQVAGIGITNQRETVVVWDKASGEPIYNAIVWQCRRTAPAVEKLLADGLGDYVREATGLIPDAYFSATKLAWILDNVPNARARAKRGELLFGTVDSWLVWKLTGAKVHATDYTNASRTMLFNIHTLCWDQRILDYFDIPAALLPEVRFSDDRYGSFNLGGAEVPLCGVAGDQQAALFGQGCFSPGQAKNTYGTGCFLLCNTGSDPVESRSRLLTTVGIAADLGGGKKEIHYALEGSVFVAGALIQWLRDGLGILKTASDSERLALQTPDSGGIYIVPAFTGLGAPYWDMKARGAIVGLTRGTGRPQLARAALEAIAFQTAAVLSAMETDTGRRIDCLRVDGGASANNLLLQIQSDLSGVTVARPPSVESTALGVAGLCGIGLGLWTARELAETGSEATLFRPQTDPETRRTRRAGWEKAVKRAENWEEN